MTDSEGFAKPWVEVSIYPVPGTTDLYFLVRETNRQTASPPWAY